MAPGGPIQVGSASKKPQHGATTMERTYEATDRADKRAAAEFLGGPGLQCSGAAASRLEAARTTVYPLPSRRETPASYS